MKHVFPHPYPTDSLQRKENRKAWVDALLSGDFRQGTGVLSRRYGDSDVRHCCLGVACTMHPGLEVVFGDGRAIANYAESSPYASSLPKRPPYNRYLPPVVTGALGLSSSRGRFRTSESLSSMNDRGATFIEIARTIEAEPAGLIREEPQ